MKKCEAKKITSPLVSKLDKTSIDNLIKSIKTDEFNAQLEAAKRSIEKEKELEADHVYIVGCNDGNIPGKNRSVYLDDHQYKQEQRRLLYVGLTRAKKSLTITWCQHIPFEQAMGNYTSSVGVQTINGKKYSRVGLSEFLQDLRLENP